jgi:hypothetical protein
MRATPPAPTVTTEGETLSGTGEATGVGTVVDVVDVVVVVVVVVLASVVVGASVEVVVEDATVPVGAALVVDGCWSAAGTVSPAEPAPAGAGPTFPSINNPHAAVPAATTTVVIPPTRITTKS